MSVALALLALAIAARALYGQLAVERFLLGELPPTTPVEVAKEILRVDAVQTAAERKGHPFKTDAKVVHTTRSGRIRDLIAKEEAHYARPVIERVRT